MLHNHPQRSILPTGPRNYSEFRALLLGNTSFTRNNEATHPADIAILQVIPRDDVAFILAAIYVHQRTNNYCLENFLRRSLLDFSNIISSGDIQIPLILMGDFNTTIQDRDRLSDFLAKHFNLTLKNNPDESTTLGGTCIDLTFSRNLDLACQPYISYFYYHRPVFNKITLPWLMETTNKVPQRVQNDSSKRKKTHENLLKWKWFEKLNASFYSTELTSENWSTTDKISTLLIRSQFSPNYLGFPDNSLSVFNWSHSHQLTDSSEHSSPGPICSRTDLPDPKVFVDIKATKPSPYPEARTRMPSLRT